MHRNVRQALFAAAGVLLIAAGFARGNTETQTAAPATAQTLKPETEQLLKTGEQELTTKHYDDAVKTFKKAIKAESDKCSRCYLKLAEAQIRLGNEKEALSSCDKGVAVATDDAARAAGLNPHARICAGQRCSRRAFERLAVCAAPA